MLNYYAIIFINGPPMFTGIYSFLSVQGDAVIARYADTTADKCLLVHINFDSYPLLSFLRFHSYLNP